MLSPWSSRVTNEWTVTVTIRGKTDTVSLLLFDGLTWADALEEVVECYCPVGDRELREITIKVMREDEPHDTRH